MTEEEILKLSDEELLKIVSLQVGNAKVQEFISFSSIGGWNPLLGMDDAMELFNEIYNPKSKLYGGAWVLSTVDEGKDCSLATLFFGAPLRRARRQGRKNRPLKAQAKAKKKQMARAITLCFVMAMEGATVDLRYQPEEA